MKEYRTRIEGKSKAEISAFLKEKMAQKDIKNVIQEGEDLYTVDSKGRKWKIDWSLEPVSIESGSKEKIVSVQDIQEAVARYYHISLEDLKGKKRTKSIVEPRQIAMYLARELTNSSLPKLGTEFGKDHSTVLHAYDKINEEYKLQGDVTKAVKDLKKKLGF